MTEPLLGRFLWHELLTTDMNAAETFYGAVIGWTAAASGSGERRYDIFNRAGGVPVAGVMTLPAGMNFPPHWVMYVGVPRLEDAVAHVERRGGSSLSPIIEVPTVGRLRVIRDPQGAMFALYEPVSAPSQPEAEAEIGEVSWHELHTTDAPAALDFYSDVFGWRQTDTFDMGAMGTYHIFGRAFPLGGMMTKPPQMADVPTSWGLYFRVADAHAGAERVTASGGRVLNGPMEVPGGGWIATCLDPQGAAFSLHQRQA